MKTINLEVTDEIYEKHVSKIMEEMNAVKKKEEMRIHIKNRWTGEIIYSSTKTTMKDAVEEAVSNDYDLRYSDLRGSDLSYSNLSGSKLSDSDLRGSKLRYSELQNAKFYGRGGTTKIQRSQVEDFLTALGIIVED